eukprot:TRINITY_DN43465_c0_g1_i1.p1 TRINITY_DN43465_c0_g1~~TRINITY_DN43465_c0_g1_i1.p1  ORF type:complete len:439 (+),score=73.39 TRINITY_DN43465_c0_g1_i1:64-1317(+)
MTWFKDLFGFEEKTGSAEAWRSMRRAFKYDAATGRLTVSDPAALRGQAMTRTFQAGWFSTPSLAELRNRVDLRSAEVSKALPGGLLVNEIVGDISEVHARPENNYALFQAASQFNSLEHVSHQGVPEDGIAGYSFDRTQGPACATSCAPGTILRNYLADKTDATSLHAKKPGQTRSNQVQNLRDIELALDNGTNKYFKVQSGYTMGSSHVEGGVALARLASRLSGNSVSDFREELMSKVRIGLQRETEVTNLRFGASRCETKGLLVTQAYCSAVSVSYSGLSQARWAPFARLILAALYEATLLAAVENALKNPDEPGARRVFLTLLGGGVFGNDLLWILDAMRRAFALFAGVGLEVVIVSFGRPLPELKPFLGQRPSPLPAVPRGVAGGTNGRGVKRPAASNTDVGQLLVKTARKSK